MSTASFASKSEWLAARRTGIGSSDAAAVLGVSPWATPLQVYLEKIGEAPEREQTGPMRLGLLLEPIIAQLYSDDTGYGFQDEQRFVRSQRYPWLIATLDRVREDERVVELKSVGRRQADEWGESGTDEVPRWVACQVLHQMIAAGAEVADVAALICGQELRIYHLERDDQLTKAIIEREGEFWDKVVSRVPPAVNPDKDARLLSRLFPDSVGEVALGADATRIVQEWERLGKEAGEADKARKRLKIDLLMALGNAASATLADGRILTRKVIHVKEAHITRKAYDTIDLRLKGGSRE